MRCNSQQLVSVPPSPIPPPGLDPARLGYLYKNIRQFVPDANKDILCPLPTAADQTTENNVEDGQSDASSDTPPVKKSCGRGQGRGRGRGQCRSRGRVNK